MTVHTGFLPVCASETVLSPADPQSTQSTALRRQMALLVAAMDHMDQGLLMIDAAGNVPVYNKRVLELLDLPSEFMSRGPSYREIIDYQMASQEFVACDDDFKEWVVAPGSEQISRRYVRARPDGRVIEVRSVPLEGGGAVRTFVDITETYKQQDDLRTAQQELIAAREKSEAANRAKSDFLAAMSHEIRTPLNAVLGLATCLLESKLGHEERRMVQTIHDSGDSLLQILNDILDFSKLEARQLTFEHIAFSPETLSANVVSILGVRACAKGLSLTCESSGRIPQGLIGDVGRIRQVLLNLVTNAVKFTETGSVAIGLQLIAREKDVAHLEWSVTDTGIGISASGLSKLFQDFSQADSSINRRFGGSGLGLAICKRIIEQMDGEIGVESELGRGSKFWFRLKLPIASTIAGGQSHDHELQDQLKQKLSALGRPLRVLVVDDNATNRLVAGKILSEFQPITNFACDGNEAITAVHRFRYDLVLMDMHMPELDGLGATKAIRTAGLTVPVVAFTANAFKEDIDACIAAGMSDFVAKPVRRKDLVRALLKNVHWEGRAGHCEPVSERSDSPAVADAGISGPVVDRRALSELASEIGADGVAMAASAFFDDAERKLEQLVVASLAANRSEIGRAAHAIKGAAATIALDRLSALARDLEFSATTITQPDFEKAVADLRHEVATAKAEMLALIPGLADTECAVAAFAHEPA